jgi:putative ABC transport system permease protein
MVDLYGFAPRSIVTLPIAGKAVQFHVSGVWRDYGRPHGAVQIDRDDFVALTGDQRATTAALWLDDERRLAEISEAVRNMLREQQPIEISTPGQIRELSLAAFDRTFAVTYALELAGIAIGLVGLSSAFGGLVLARRREFGVLRHLGMTRRQIGVMLATEGGVTSAIGVAAGVALGFVVSLVLIHVVNRQSFHWGMSLRVPSLELAAFVVVVIALATLTAVVSGRRAMGNDVVGAVKEDW